jgi:hypothetical protein
VYNSSAETVGVIGETCHGCFQETINPKDHKSCPGDKQGCRGTTWISWRPFRPLSWNPQGATSCSVDGPKDKSSAVDTYRFMGEIIAKTVTGEIAPGMYYCPHQVPAHGWVTIKGEKGELCHVKDAGGKMLYDGPAKAQCGPKK